MANNLHTAGDMPSAGEKEQILLQGQRDFYYIHTKLKFSESHSVLQDQGQYLQWLCET